jgi:nitrite reductase/ring-hydroxylating ferredoxin subunit
MQRRDFLEKLGIGAAFALTTSCLHSCTNDPTTTTVDFTLNLDDNVKLLTKGNYIIKNNVVVAFGTDGNYYAATVVCSHEDLKKNTYNSKTNEYYCTEHGARFDLTGAGLNKEGSKGITIYKTALTDKNLRIFSA